MNYMAIPGIENKPRQRSIDIIISTVCAHYGQPRKEVLSKSRKREYVEARHIIASLVRNCTVKTTGNGYTHRHSTAHIGLIFSPPRDHATIIHSCKVVDNLFSYNVEFRMKLNNIIDELHKYGIYHIVYNTTLDKCLQTS